MFENMTNASVFSEKTLPLYNSVQGFKNNKRGTATYENYPQSKRTKFSLVHKKHIYLFCIVFFFPKDSNYGYTKDNCANEAKKELLAQELLGCSFQSSQTALKRCNVEDSARFYRSFIDTNNTDIFRVNVVNISTKEGLKDRYDKTCIQDCIQDR